MPRKLIILLFFIFVAVPAYAAASSQFSFQDINGKTYDSAGLKGTALVIYVGSHW
ncbi:hypothetical protein MNBD_DELTA03-813 [hydrothermal vent metagenome]|uniref:Uncharacterized protein n=1 Tax=hydrothermal vent metagenome TaxID=652676 RepID=A0A3B0VHH5_9ZZZZ